MSTWIVFSVGFVLGGLAYWAYHKLLDGAEIEPADVEKELRDQLAVSQAENKELQLALDRRYPDAGGKINMECWLSEAQHLAAT